MAETKKKTIFSLLIKYKYSFLAGLLALSLVDICQLSIPLVIERVVDTLTLEKPQVSDITRFGLYMVDHSHGPQSLLLSRRQSQLPSAPNMIKNAATT